MSCQVLENLRDSKAYAKIGGQGLPPRCHWEESCQHTPDGCVQTHQTMNTPSSEAQKRRSGRDRVNRFLGIAANSLGIIRST